MAGKPPSLDSLLECPICLSECEDPRVLTCLHTLCLKCLDQHINASAEGSNFFCPSCRHKCEVPAGGVTSIPKNFFWNSLKAILKQQDSGERLPLSATLPVLQLQQECSNSGRGKTSCGTVTVFCVECAKFLCSECESSHLKYEEFSGHQLAPVCSADARVIQAALLKRKTPRCDNHPTLPTDMYCDTCRVPVCLKCCVLKHKQHAYSEIDETAKESRSLLSSLTETAEKIASRLSNSMQELDESEKKINTDCEEACREVNKNAEEIQALVAQRAQSAIQEIRQAQSTTLTQLKAAYKEAEINKAAIESLVSYIQALLVSEDATSQVVHAPGLQEQLRQHEAAPLQSVTLEVNLERETQSLSAPKYFVCTVLGSKSTVANDSLGGIVPKEMKVSLGPPLLDLKPDFTENISGLVMIGDFVFVTGYSKPYLWIHNTKKSNQKRHTVDGLKAAGMSVVHGDTLVITDRNRRLHLMKIDNQLNIKYHLIKDFSFQPEDVSVDSAHCKLIIANQTNEQIVTCDGQGNIERNTNVKTSVGYLRCALATSNGYLVLDYSSNKLHWLSREGDVVHTYGESLLEPLDVAQDSQGRVIIADWHHHKLHLVDVNKDLSHYLLTEKDGIKEPTCVYLDEVNSRLWVGHKDTSGTHKVSMYKWPFVSSSSREHTSLTHHKLHVKLTRYQ